MGDVLSEADLPEVPELGDAAVRRLLGSGGMKVFRNIMKAWGAAEAEERRLLGLAPETRLDELDPERLTEEQMVRISYVIGIYNALQVYWKGELADRWVGLPNREPMFGDQAPLAYMAQGGLEAMRNVRRVLDAWCAGN